MKRRTSSSRASGERSAAYSRSSASSERARSGGAALVRLIHARRRQAPSPSKLVLLDSVRVSDEPSSVRRWDQVPGGVIALSFR